LAGRFRLIKEFAAYLKLGIAQVLDPRR
jgi:hypothetical protein